MKKLIFLLFTITFIIVSFLSIKQFEFLQFQSFNYHNDSSGEKWNVEIKESNSQKSKLQNYQLLTEIASKAKVNLQRISYEKTNKNLNKIVYYVSFYDSSMYFEEMKIKTGEYLNENSDPDDFLSTEKTGSKSQIGQIEIFHSFDPIEIRPMIAAEKIKDIKGTYTLNGNNNAKEFKEIAIDYGFSLNLSKEQSFSQFTSYPYQNMIYIASIILCLLIMLAMSYDVINNYKDIAIRYMFGDNFFHIGAYLFRKYIKVVLSSLTLVLVGLLLFLFYYNQYQQFFYFLSFWLKNIMILLLIILLILIFIWIGTKSINISQMVKNKKPLKLFFYLNIMIRFILAIFLILGLQQVINTFQELRDSTAQQEKWELMKNYSILGIVNSEIVDFQNDEKNKLRFNKLYRDLESQGAVYIAPSYYYMEKANLDDPNPWGMNGKQVVINENYLSINPIYDLNNKKILMPLPSKNEITVLVPKRYEKNEEEIKETLEKDYSGMLNMKSPESVHVNLLYVKNDQSYFTFSTQMAVDSKFQIKDPIAVIITDKFMPAYTSSTLAMGYGYFTKNVMKDNPFEKTQETIKKYGFNNMWEPVSIAYSNVEQKMKNNTENLQLTTIYCVLFLVLATVLLFFSGIYYLEMNKQLLALQWIFGYSFFEKHNLIYLSVLVFWQLSFMVCFFISNNIELLSKITLGLAFCDFLLLSFLLIIKEHKITKQLLIEK
jgi:putative ABC transport system permease protein